jgi:hypothetical protein
MKHEKGSAITNAPEPIWFTCLTPFVLATYSKFYVFVVSLILVCLLQLHSDSSSCAIDSQQPYYPKTLNPNKP